MTRSEVLESLREEMVLVSAEEDALEVPNLRDYYPDHRAYEAAMEEWRDEKVRLRSAGVALRVRFRELHSSPPESGS